jgi:uncharacterized protein YjbI with pentapeptide repeats
MKKLVLISLSIVLLAPGTLAYKQEDLDKLKEANECVGCDLSGANFYEADLSEVNLEGAILHSTNLRRANLTNANLTDALFFRADLFGANLTNVNLKGAKFCNTIMPLGSIGIKDC